MSVNCDPQAIATEATCFQCIPDGRKLDLLIYLFRGIANVNLTPEQLMELSKCFVCVPPGRKLDVLNYLACQILNAGGTAKVCILGGVGAPAMAVPFDFSAYVEQPGPNFGLWLGDLATGWANVVAQGP